MKIFKSFYRLAKDLIKGAAQEFVEAAEAVQADEQAKPQPRDYIVPVEVRLGPCTTVIRYKWINTFGHVVGWYNEEGLRALAPGVADEIRRSVAVIDEVLGCEGPPRPLYRGDPDQ